MAVTAMVFLAMLVIPATREPQGGARPSGQGEPQGESLGESLGQSQGDQHRAPEPQRPLG